MTIFHRDYIISQTRNDFMEHRPPSPVIQDATYTKHVYQHSKHNVGVGSCIKGGNHVGEAKTPIVALVIVAVLYK